MSISFAEAIDVLLSDIADGRCCPILKRATIDMVEFYVGEGWRFHEYDPDGHVLLIWPKQGAPE